MKIEALKAEELQKRADEGTLVGVFLVDNEDYHRGPGVSCSGLIEIRRTPAHFLQWKLHPPGQTPALVLGSGIHTAALEPEKFDERFAVKPDCDRRTKEGKEVYAKFEETLNGRAIVTADQVETITGIRAAVYSNENAALLLDTPHKELTFYWKDQETGVLCRCKPDAICRGGFLLDLKTTEDASGLEFRRKVENYSYDMQIAMALAGVREALSQSGRLEECKDMVCDIPVFLAVEKEEPYLMALYTLPTAWLERGFAKFRRALCIYAECQRTGVYPGYPTEITTLEEPAWAAKESL
jgi:hypothetical protein